MLRYETTREIRDTVGVPVANIMVQAGWAPSVTQARKLIKQGGVKLTMSEKWGPTVVTDPFARLAQIPGMVEGDPERRVFILVEAVA